MSLCASCGLSLSGDAALCPHHHCAYGDDWPEANRRMCNFFHRGDIALGAWRREAVEAAFYALVDREGPLSRAHGTRCWLWRGPRAGGVPTWCRAGWGPTPARRFAFELVHGPAWDGYDVLPGCRRTRSCVRPEHAVVVEVAPQNGHKTEWTGALAPPISFVRLEPAQRDDDFWPPAGEAV